MQTLLCMEVCFCLRSEDIVMHLHLREAGASWSAVPEALGSVSMPCLYQLDDSWMALHWSNMNLHSLVSVPTGVGMPSQSCGKRQDSDEADQVRHMYGMMRCSSSLNLLCLQTRLGTSPKTLINTSILLCARLCCGEVSIGRAGP